MQQSIQESPILSVNQFYEAMGKNVGKSYIYENCRAGNIKNVRIGTKILIFSSELIDWPARLANPAN